MQRRSSGGRPRQREDSLHPGAIAHPCSPILGLQVGSILACAAARAFASSLLDRRFHKGADGTPRRVLKFLLISAGRHQLSGGLCWVLVSAPSVVMGLTSPCFCDCSVLKIWPKSNGPSQQHTTTQKKNNYIFSLKITVTITIILTIRGIISIIIVTMFTFTYFFFLCLTALRQTALRRTAEKFALFFFPSPATFQGCYS